MYVFISNSWKVLQIGVDFHYNDQTEKNTENYDLDWSHLNYP